MTFTIPSGLQSLYQEYADSLLISDMTSSQCKLVYPGKREECPNCTFNSFGGTSTNVYKSGGPQPFNFGVCPLCGGAGYKEKETTENVRLRIYWSRRDWRKVGIDVQIPDAEVMTIGYLSDLPKCEQADEIVIPSGQSGYHNWSFELAGEPFPHGFGKDRYFVAFWKRTA